MGDKRRFQLIINPYAGYGRRRFSFLNRWLSSVGTSQSTDAIVEEISSIFEASHINLDVLRLEPSIDLSQLLSGYSSESYDAVIVAGGDGTINAAINGLVGTGIPLGVIPVGSVNVFAASLGISSDLRKACTSILRGETVSVDLGKIDDRYFAAMAGMGFDAFVIKHLDPKMKKRWGLISYLIRAVISCFRYSFSKVLFTVNGESSEREAVFFIINNTAAYGGSFIVSDRIRYDDGALDLCYLKRGGVWAMCRFFWALYQGTLSDCEDVEQLQLQSLSVTHGRLPVHVDAEYLGDISAKVCVFPSAIQVFKGNALNVGVA